MNKNIYYPKTSKVFRESKWIGNRYVKTVKDPGLVDISITRIEILSPELKNDLKDI